MASVSVTLVSKPGCHLCDDARDVVSVVTSEFGDRVAVDELSILDDETLFERYVEEIPVVLIDGRVHNIWRVDADRFRRALEEAVR